MKLFYGWIIVWILWLRNLSQPVRSAEVQIEMQSEIRQDDKRPDPPVKPEIFPGFDSTSLEEFVPPCSEYDSEECGKEFLKEYNRVFTRNSHYLSKEAFEFSTDLKNKEIKKQMIEHQFKAGEFARKARHLAEKFEFKKFSESVKRQFTFITESIALEDPVKKKEAINLSANLESLYGSAKACPKGTSCLGPGEQEVENFMKMEQDYDKLADVFDAWQDATGKTLEPSYTRFVALENEGARLHGYKDAGYANWFLDMRESDFDSQVLHHFEQLKPLYQQLHAHVRHKLVEKYTGRFKPNDPIPAHILGNPWGQNWQGLSKLVTPYPEVKLSNLSSALVNISSKVMMKMAEEFFVSIGLHPMTSDFWKRSVLDKIPDRVMQCHAAAYDIGNAQDYRIRMCYKKDLDTFTTMHHEMGHVEYYMCYSNLPKPFRAGANEAFHEAIGDTIALSVNTPEHYHTKKLIESVPSGEKFDMNYLMHTALAKIVFLPFGLLCDVWRWRVFNGTVPREKYNEEWWKLRVELQGLMPPHPRHKTDVDALSKYHIAVGISYIRYFISFIMQFQFYEALCNASGYKGPLHRCDYYNSKPAGAKLRKMLEMGASRPWEDAMQVMTGQRNVNTSSLLRYYQPLYEWLQKENKRLNIPIGWNTPTNILI